MPNCRGCPQGLSTGLNRRPAGVVEQRRGGPNRVKSRPRRTEVDAGLPTLLSDSIQRAKAKRVADWPERQPPRFYPASGREYVAAGEGGVSLVARSAPAPER